MATPILFVGGLYDGKRVLFNDDLPPIYASLLAPSAAEKVGIPLSQADIQQGVYRIIRVAIGQSNYSLYVADTITDAALFDTLFSGKYSRKT